MSRGASRAYANMQNMMTADQIEPDTLYLLKMNGVYENHENSSFCLKLNSLMLGRDSQCGCVFCCPGSAAKVDINLTLLPIGLQGVLGVEEIQVFAQEVRSYFGDTSVRG